MNTYTSIAAGPEVARNISEWGGVTAPPAPRFPVSYIDARRARNGLQYSLEDLLAHDIHPHDIHALSKLLHQKEAARLPMPRTREELLSQRLLIGYIRAACELPSLRKLLTRGRWSRTGMTYYGLSPADARRLCPSPHRLDRWVRKVMRRAALILQPYGCRPSYRQLIDTLREARRAVAAACPTLPRAHKAAIRLAAEVLRSRWRLPQELRPLDVLIHCRCYRQSALPGDPREVPRESLDSFGPRSGDDRINIWSPHIVCMARDGAVIRAVSDREQPRRDTVVQVVVQCPSTGLQHRITVPPWFGLPLQEGESAAARVHAAVAWTFRLTPAEYQPGKES
jgi:hypothetical protein